MVVADLARNVKRDSLQCVQLLEGLVELAPDLLLTHDHLKS